MAFVSSFEEEEEVEEVNDNLGSSSSSVVSNCNKLAESVVKLSESKGVVVYRSEKDLLLDRRNKTGGVATIRPNARRVADRGKEADHDLGVYFILFFFFLSL